MRKDLKMICRGYKTIYGIAPKCLIYTVLYSFFDSLSPFVNIYMSACILNGLSKKLSVRYLVYLVVITLLLDLVIYAARRILSEKKSVYIDTFWDQKEMFYAKKAYTADYEHIENPEIRKMRDEIWSNENATGSGIYKLIFNIDNVIRNGFTVIFSIGLSISLFLSFTVNTNMGFAAIVNSLPFSVLMAVIIVGAAIFSVHINSIAYKNDFEIMKDLPTMNTLCLYYDYSYIPGYKAGKDIRIFNQKNLIMDEIVKNYGNPSFVKKSIRNASKYDGINSVVSSCTNGLVLLYVAIKALTGAIGIGGIVQYTGAIRQFCTGLSGFINAAYMLKLNNLYLEKVFRYLDIPDNMYQGTIPVEKRDDNEYEIEFKNVSFKYPGTDSYALKNISIKLKIGERLAVVGMNGSGKTTFIKLLCRLYDPTEGVITLNGIDIRKYDYKEYMSIFSVVFQDFKLFSFSIGQNVSASVDFDGSKAEECLNKAGFGERYKSMKKGLQTCIYKDFEEDGVEISGGEAQKIAIARALYKDAPFLVLDEPTAALDPIAEYEIYSKFDEIIENKTAIYISHRLSSCRFCDDIAVFNEGGIIQRGSHNELVRDVKGKYYELWNAQAQYYTEKTSVQDLHICP